MRTSSTMSFNRMNRLHFHAAIGIECPSRTHSNSQHTLPWRNVAMSWRQRWRRRLLAPPYFVPPVWRNSELFSASRPFFYLNSARLAEFRLLEKPWLTHRGQDKGSTAGLRKMPQHHWSGAAAAMGEAGKRGPSAGRSPKQQRRGSSIEEAACCRLV